MALSGVLAGAAQRHAVVDGAVVADLAGLAEHDAHAVVDEQAPADGSTGVDLDAGAAASVVLVQPVRNAVIDQNMKTGVQQNDLQHAACGGVLALDVPCIFQQTHEESSLSCVHVVPIIIAQPGWNVQ